VKSSKGDGGMGDVLRYRILTITILIAVFLGLATASSGFAWMKPSNLEAYNQKNLIRLHVIANSDALVDQNLKLQIRNRIVELTEKFLLDVKDPVLAEGIIRANLDQIVAAARDEIAKHHRDLPVRAEFGRHMFPEREYPFGTLGAGEYKSLRVIVGEGKGRNWWCILYPPLCLLSPDAPAFKGETVTQKPKVQYRLALLEDWVKAKGLTMDEFWKNWGRYFGLI